MDFVIYCNSGTARYIEDGAFVNPFFGGGGVIDGGSAPYSQNEPPVLFDGGLTGGQMVASTAIAAIVTAVPGMSLGEVVLSANAEVYRKQMGREDLAGGSFALFGQKDREIEIITGGDCFAVFLPNSATDHPKATPNQAFLSEKEKTQEFAQILERHRWNKKEAWNEYAPIYREYRRNQEGVKFASLNGKSTLESLWFQGKFSLGNKGGTLLLFSDGLVLLDDTKSPESLISAICGFYKDGGVKSLIERKRGMELAMANTSRTKNQEATCVEVIFD